MVTVYCPNCGSARLLPRSEPQKIDEEVGQVLMQQFEKCAACGHVWTDKWWMVMDEFGVWNNVEADEHGNAIKGDEHNG